MGLAYRSAAGVWSVKSPVVPPNSTGNNIVLSQFAIAQHPIDNSVWVFFKRDSFAQIGAIHLTETTNDVTIDWMNEAFISQPIDGDNGPEPEFPFLVAAADSTRSRILLGYQGYRDQIVFVDDLYGSGNSIFVKKSPALIAQIAADGAKSFITAPVSMERGVQF